MSRHGRGRHESRSGGSAFAGPKRWLTIAGVLSLLSLALLPTTSMAATKTIIAGQDRTGVAAQRYAPGDTAAYVGDTVNFTFSNISGAQFHNVCRASGPGGTTGPESPGCASGSDAKGSTYVFTPSASGTYWFYCSLHAGPGDTPTTFDANGEPANGKMVGRIVVSVDSTGPVWGAGSATATAVSASQIDLSWPAASDPETGIKQYRVYEATGSTLPAKPATPVATPTGTSLSRTGLTAGLHYWYWITAVNGSGTTSTTDQLADATTTSVAASAQASGVVKFAVNPALSITVTPATLDLGTVSPAAAATGTQVVTVKSNDIWSLSMKSIGRNGVDEATGDDPVFTGAGGKTIPVSRMTWSIGGGAPSATSDAGATLLSAQPATPSTGTSTNVGLSLLILYSDPTALDYQTVILYTATQP